jgi:hemerythrin superfamily protein
VRRMGFFSKRQRIDPEGDIFELLKNDHRDVKHLFDEIQGRAEDDEVEGDADERLALFHELRIQLLAHAKAEARVVYSELELHLELVQTILEAREEHGLVEHVLDEMTGMDSADDVWMAKLKVLRDLVEHHVEEEEEAQFPPAKKVIDEEKRKQLAEAFMAAKAEELTMLDDEAQTAVEVLMVEDIERLT